MPGKNAQHCIIPVEAIYEPDWRSGKAIATRVSSANGEPLGIAGLWSSWKSPQGWLHSFTLLTINADGHDLGCAIEIKVALVSPFGFP